MSHFPSAPPASLLDNQQVLAFLANVSALLSESLEPASIYERLARLAVPALADSCAVLSIDEEGALQLAAVAHAEPAAERALRELARRRPPSFERSPDYVAAILRAAPVLVGPSGPEQHVSVVAPLTARGHTLGLIELGLGPSGRAYGPADLPVVRELARRAALAADNAQLYAEARAASAALREANRRLEALSRESDERFRHAFEDAATGMSLVAPDGRWLRINRALCEMLGYSEAELLALRYQDLTHPDDHHIDAELGAQLLSGALAAGHVEKRYLRKDGRVVWVLMSVSLLRDAAGRPAYFLSQKQDITARKAAEASLVALNRRLELSNRELQDFASVASHDLQEPLRKIQAFGDRLRARHAEALDAGGLDYLSRILSAAQRMQALINDLLAFSRVSSRTQPFEPLDLAAVAAEVAGDLETQVERTGGRIEIGALPTIEADRLQMRQLLQNLLSNALKFHREGVPPLVRVWAEPLDARGEPTAGRPHQHRLYVADNGIGFAEKYLDRIFTVFQRLHGREQYEGTGIGLAICRRIVDRHGGTITAASSPGEGATFLITLPARQS